MNICGILIAKKNSNRFPDKNYLLFEKNLDLLIDVVGRENVYMATDDKRIKTLCYAYDIYIIHRGPNIIGDEMPYLDVLKFAYYSIPKKYDIIVTVLCNSINHTESEIRKGIEILKTSHDNKATEARSFDKNGNQSGIFIFRADKLPEKWHHICAFESNGREIHYRSDLNE